MKLWLISQDWNGGDDVYDSCVVAAETEEDARRISPDEFSEWDDERQEFMFTYGDGLRSPDPHTSWAPPQYVTVKYLGEAKEGTERGVIHGSFHAG